MKLEKIEDVSFDLKFNIIVGTCFSDPVFGGLNVVTELVTPKKNKGCWNYG